MTKTILRILAVLVIGIVAGVVGLIVGALIGGNFAQQFIFNGVQGYEATGQVGFLIGAVVGLTAGWKWLLKKK
jgi:hypothetical protein